MENNDTGLLLNKKDIEMHRKWFKEMCNLIGIKVLFRSLKEPYSNWNLHGELDAHYNAPVLEGCIFDEHPTQWTMKKLGWNAEQNDSTSIIHVRYDLEGLEAGALFVIPSGIDHSEGRVFRVTRMSTIQIYPASVACEIAPEWEDEQEASEVNDFSKSDFNVMKSEDNF